MEEFGIIFAVAIIIGLIPAGIASSKGHSFQLWWLYGTALFFFAMIHSILIKPTEENQLQRGGRRCPHCAEIVKDQAKVCRFCGKDILSKKIPSTSKATIPLQSVPKKSVSKKKAIFCYSCTHFKPSSTNPRCVKDKERSVRTGGYETCDDWSSK